MNYLIPAKYIAYIAAIFIVLVYVLQCQLTIENILVSVGAMTISIILIDIIIESYQQKEHMMNVSYFPDTYTLSRPIEDQGESGILYDNDSSYLYPTDDHHKEGQLPLNAVQKAMCADRVNRLSREHNFNIISSPHTHIGKARGYLDWELPGSCLC